MKNIAEILKYCPKGTKLYSLIDGEVTLKSVNIAEKYPIETVTNDFRSNYYTKDGLFFSGYPNGECLLFPSKDQRDWNKFRIPIKKGDIMTDINGYCPFIATGELYCNISPKYICGINSSGEFQLGSYGAGWTSDYYIPASEEVKKKLFDKMEEAGYRWNADTLELEKIEHKLIKQEFKPFDKVLVRDSENEKWSVNIFSYYSEENKDYHYVCLDDYYHYCVPYEGNEYFVGKTANIH